MRKKNGAILMMVCGFVIGCSTQPQQPGSLIPGLDSAPDDSRDYSDLPDAIPVPITGAVKKSPYTLHGIRYQPLSSARNYEAEGIASWYGVKFHGRSTANGEKYDMYKMTAAHKTLPLPSFAKVTNLENGRSVVVRVNDRGPYYGNRLIDLSWAAASKLGYQNKGTVKVRVEGIVVEPGQTYAQKKPSKLPQAEYFLQVGAWANLSSAESVKKKLMESVEPNVRIEPVDLLDQTLYRVRVGPLAMTDVTQQQDYIQSLGFPVPTVIKEK